MKDRFICPLDYGILGNINYILEVNGQRQVTTESNEQIGEQCSGDGQRISDRNKVELEEYKRTNGRINRILQSDM